MPLPAIGAHRAPRPASRRIAASKRPRSRRFQRRAAVIRERAAGSPRLPIDPVPRRAAMISAAESGGIQIELIVPGPAPSTYHDFLQSGGRGVHHIGFASHDFDAQRAAGLEAGLSIAMEGRSARTRFSDLEGPAAAPGPIVELIEMSPVITDVFERVRTAAAGWAGEDPIRAL